MSILISTTDKRTQLGAILLDCLLSEEINFESQVTLYPVEDGTEISDHITQGTKRVRISGVISTADISGGFGFSSLFGYATDNSMKFIDVVEEIEAMYKGREMLNIFTAQVYYENMAFTSLNVSRSADGLGGNWASIKAELIKINKVSLKTASVPAPETTAEPATGRSGETNKPAGKSTANASGKDGSQGTQAASQKESILYNQKNNPQSLLNTIKGSLGK
jgi:hypothetical protein